MRREVPKGDITKHGQAQMPRALGLGPWQVTSERSISAPSRSGSWIMTFPLPCEARAGGECEADTVHAQPPRLLMEEMILPWHWVSGWDVV